MTEPVIDAKAGRIATITLNRPGKYNMLRPDMIDGLKAVLGDANLDNETRVIYCVGDGCELALCADLVIASERALRYAGPDQQPRKRSEPGL